MGADTHTTPFPVRVLRLGFRVGQRYLDIAQQEAADDAQRLVGIAFLTGLTLVLSAHLLAVLHFFVVAMLSRIGVPIVLSLAGLASVDLLGVVLLLRAVYSRILTPWMPQTRDRIADLAILLADDPS